MAVQANGITVISVDPLRKRIRFLVGSVDVVMWWDVSTKTFPRAWTSLCWIDGRRGPSAPRLVGQQRQYLDSQANGIAKSRGW